MKVLLVTGIYPGVRMGGAEYQTALLGRGLVEKGHNVLFLATATGTSDSYTKEGVDVCELPGYAVVGHAAHRRQIEAILDEYCPDICYVRLLLDLMDITPLCRARAIPVVSVSCSLRETSPFLVGYSLRGIWGRIRSRQMIRHWRSFRAIRDSAAHVCNTKDLARRVQPWLADIEVQTIYNGSPPAPAEEIHQSPGNRVIWVNNFKRGKRPELFIQLAHRLPQYEFVMIGAMLQSGKYAAQLHKQLAAAPPNFTYLGQQPVDEVNRQIGRSDLLVYTSQAGVEGFGNSFLQAWFRGVPTGSLDFELDGILEEEQVGFCAKSFGDFVDGVQALMDNPERRMAMGRRAFAYAQENFRVDAMVERYEALYTNIVSTSRKYGFEPASPSMSARESTVKGL